MKYQCLNDICKYVFIHPGKRTINTPSGNLKLVYPSLSRETYVCPICGSFDFEEYKEPENEITSVKSVPLEEVDTYLKDGYTVKELYARSATLVKAEVKRVVAE